MEWNKTVRNSGETIQVDEMLELEGTMASETAMSLRTTHEFNSEFTKSRQTRTDLGVERAEHGNTDLLHFVPFREERL
jgi:hypothetical protein